jgi:hypothetical protein
MVRAPLVETCPNRSEWSCELDQYHPNSRGLVPSHHEIFPTAIPILRRDSRSLLDHDGCRVAHLRVGPRPSNLYNPSLSLADECGRIPPARVESRRSLKKSCGAANPGRSRLSRRLDPLKAGLRAGLPAPLSGMQRIFHGSPSKRAGFPNAKSTRLRRSLVRCTNRKWFDPRQPPAEPRRPERCRRVVGTCWDPASLL